MEHLRSGVQDQPGHHGETPSLKKKKKKNCSKKNCRDGARRAQYAQAGLEPLGSSNPPASASQSVGITGVSPRTG